MVRVHFPLFRGADGPYMKDGEDVFTTLIVGREGTTEGVWSWRDSPMFTIKRLRSLLGNIFHDNNEGRISIPLT